MLRMQSREKEKELQKVKGVKDIVPDFDQWPESWMGTKRDFEYGKKLLPFMGRFLSYLICQDLSRETLKSYVEALSKAKDVEVKGMLLKNLKKPGCKVYRSLLKDRIREIVESLKKY
jgi:hypothetical protein